MALSEGSPQIASGCLKRSNGTWAEIGEETLNLLLKTHFPGATDQALNMSLIDKSQPVMADLFTKENQAWEIGFFKPYKTPGPDEVYRFSYNNLWS